MRDGGIDCALLWDVRRDVLRLVAVAVAELKAGCRARRPIDARQPLIVVRSRVFVAEEVVGVAASDVIRQGDVIEQ